ncbi:unnamed protein product [Meloidogyne enterolobii]
MSEIADMTHDITQFHEIMPIIWKRLNDQGKNWRHVYKSTVLLYYLIGGGSERVAQECKENLSFIKTLKDFQYRDQRNREFGFLVREKAEKIVDLLTNDEKLKYERTRFLLAQERFTFLIPYDGTRRAGTRCRRTIDSNGGFEEARPSSLGEKEMQLQIALALSNDGDRPVEFEEVRPYWASLFLFICELLTK